MVFRWLCGCLKIMYRTNSFILIKHTGGTITHLICFQEKKKRRLHHRQFSSRYITTAMLKLYLWIYIMCQSMIKIFYFHQFYEFLSSNSKLNYSQNKIKSVAINVELWRLSHKKTSNILGISLDSYEFISVKSYTLACTTVLSFISQKICEASVKNLIHIQRAIFSNQHFKEVSIQSMLFIPYALST